MTALLVNQLGKTYGTGPDAVAVFEGIDLQVDSGEFVAIVGESGAGKSTFLNCLAGLDAWNSGEILLCGHSLNALDGDQRAVLRRAKVGFVFQAFHVMPHLDVAHNVALPLMLLGHGLNAQTLSAVQEALIAVGLDGLGKRLPAQLSGGQLQRVAIARALVHQPAVLLADEPTGNLDTSTAARVLDVLIEQAAVRGSAVVLVTHSAAAAKRADRMLRLTRSGLHPI